MSVTFRLYVAVLLMLTLVVAGCQRAPRGGGVEPAMAEGEPLVAPPARTLAVGDRVEVVLIGVDAWVGETRFRAVVRPTGQVQLPALGDFPAVGRSARQLEQDMLKTLQRGGELNGSVRVTLSPIHREGLFLAAPITQFSGIASDPAQAALLDRDEHPVWQWIAVPADLDRASLMELATTERGGLGASASSGGRYTLGRPAHVELVEPRLRENVLALAGFAARDSASSGLTVYLRSGAAAALEQVTRENLGRPLLLVEGGHTRLAPIITGVQGEELVIAFGAEPHATVRDIFTTAMKAP